MSFEAEEDPFLEVKKEVVKEKVYVDLTEED